MINALTAQLPGQIKSKDMFADDTPQLTPRHRTVSSNNRLIVTSTKSQSTLPGECSTSIHQSNQFNCHMAMIMTMSFDVFAYLESCTM